MKALILAAGLGTRLRPVTNTIPKPLVPIAGRPLLWFHLESLRHYGIVEVLINTHYLSEEINGFISSYNSKQSDMRVVAVYEENLLGSAGTLKKNIDFFQNEKNFFVVYGDNLTNINYDKLAQEHVRNCGVATIASYYEAHPESKGIVVCDGHKQIVRFIEKPKSVEVVSHQANAGVYVLNAKIFDYLSHLESGIIDFGKDLFPLILQQGGKLYTYEMDEFLLDVGTLENYNLAQEKIQEIKFNFIYE